MRAPIIGSATATDSIPAPPINEISSAPPRGNCSAVTPIIVGQKKLLPIAEDGSRGKRHEPRSCPAEDRRASRVPRL